MAQQPVTAAKKNAKPRNATKITPQIPKANRYQKGKVFLENADLLVADENRSTDYQVLKGNVRFRRGNMYMFCDSAYFYEATSSLDAFGHVRMTQGDTLKVNADILHYYGNEEIAELRRNVRLENRSTTLVTDSLDYEIASNVGYYFSGGTIVDNRNDTELSSQYGRYELGTKQAEFLHDVHLINEKYEMFTDQLNYDLRTHVASIVSETEIRSDGSSIHATNGWYNTSHDDATLYQRGLITAKDGQTLEGDTVYYNRARNFGEARGNVIIHDPKNQVILDGDYGYHDDNTHYSYVTRRARAREFSQGDTLYIHADTLCTLLDQDSLRLIKAFSGTRFYRKDFQGICDSLQLSERDSIINMYRNAVIWNENRQIYGNEINIHLIDSAADWATLPDFGFIAEHLGENYYNQLSGKKMKAWFEQDKTSEQQNYSSSSTRGQTYLRQLDVDGNVIAIFYPQEQDSTYNKQVQAEGGYLRVSLKPGEVHERIDGTRTQDQAQIDKIVLWPDVTGVVTPLYLLKKAQLYQQQFHWFNNLRPQTPNDIFNNNASQLEELKNAGRRRSSRPTS